MGDNFFHHGLLSGIYIFMQHHVYICCSSLITVCIVYRKFKNTAARILAYLPRISHISATLFDVHWLQIRYRITFKICILTYHRTAPSYLCDLIVPYVNTRSLRSNDKCLIKPCKPRLRLYGERCFKYDGPQEWNKLPIYICKSSSLSIF